MIQINAGRFVSLIVSIMPRDHLLEKYGLFSARVPRYTSYPPANQFKSDVGLRKQDLWLSQVDAEKDVSLYIHIPFCKRLCWFCACRTQGTVSKRPLETYVEHLLKELAHIRAKLPPGVKMQRLHLGGGTPTILSAALMDRLLEAVFTQFSTGAQFEFSLEVDPTDAEPDVLDVLFSYGLHRASVGVQDFDPEVQKAIGREQSVAQTRDLVHALRKGGVTSVNFDLLYGLPFQDRESLSRTIETVLDLRPDRLALYGYAHVPWMSKRQVMINGKTLPDVRQRFEMSEYAAARFAQAGYVPLGIDHFALPSDSLTRAAQSQSMCRNFQGYTDDTAPVLIGLGASAISKFPQGFVQNAVSTSAYLERISRSDLAGFKGYALTEKDQVMSSMVEQLMCYGKIDFGETSAAHAPISLAQSIRKAFPEVTEFDGKTLKLLEPYLPLARIVAGALEGYAPSQGKHSLAV